MTDQPVSDDGPSWGVIEEDGSFRVIPKKPLTLAGFTTPPFDVTRPDGRVLHIVAIPDASAPAAAVTPNEVPEP